LNFEVMGDQLSAVMTLMLLSVQWSMPLGIIWFLRRNISNLDEAEFLQKYGPIYDGMRRNPVQLYFFAIFSFRRLILIFTVIFLSNYSAF
jgi:hypothetical protein